MIVTLHPHRTQLLPWPHTLSLYIYYLFIYFIHFHLRQNGRSYEQKKNTEFSVNTNGVNYPLCDRRRRVFQAVQCHLR